MFYITYRIWKRKPWRDKWNFWRPVSPEFPSSFITFREAYVANKNRIKDGALTKIMPEFHWRKLK